jgi:hypothetical protein
MNCAIVHFTIQGTVDCVAEVGRFNPPLKLTTPKDVYTLIEKINEKWPVDFPWVKECSVAFIVRGEVVRSSVHNGCLGKMDILKFIMTNVRIIQEL